jgi:hypothetical protein
VMVSYFFLFFFFFFFGGGKLSLLIKNNNNNNKIQDIRQSSSQALNPSVSVTLPKKKVDGEPNFTEKLYFVGRKVNCLGEEDQKK